MSGAERGQGRSRAGASPPVGRPHDMADWGNAGADGPIKRRTGRNALLAASAASMILALYHFIGGTPEVMHPLYETDLPLEAMGVLVVLWYQMGAFLLAAALALMGAALHEKWRLPVACLVGGHFLIIMAICLVMSLWWFGQPWTLFQWTAFGLIGIVTVWAGWKSRTG